MTIPAAPQERTCRGSQSGCRSFAMSIFWGHALACPLFFMGIIFLVRLLAGPI